MPQDMTLCMYISYKICFEYQFLTLHLLIVVGIFMLQFISPSFILLPILQIDSVINSGNAL